MDTNNMLMLAALIVGVLSWMVFVLGMYRISRIYRELSRINRELSINLAAINGNFKNALTAINEISIEQRRTNQLLIEFLDQNGRIDESDSVAHQDD